MIKFGFPLVFLLLWLVGLSVQDDERIKLSLTSKYSENCSSPSINTVLEKNRNLLCKDNPILAAVLLADADRPSPHRTVLIHRNRYIQIEIPKVEGRPQSRSKYVIDCKQGIRLSESKLFGYGSIPYNESAFILYTYVRMKSL